METEVRIIEGNSRTKAYITNMKLYAKISIVEVFRENKMIMIRDRLVIPLEDRIKTIRNFMPMWVVSATGEKLVRPILTRKSVIVQNNLTIEINDKEYSKCKNVLDLKVCTGLPNILHNPGNNDCISKMALERPIS